MGQQSTQAALIYLHATEQRDREIAVGLDEQIGKARARERNGTKRTANDDPRRS